MISKLKCLLIGAVLLGAVSSQAAREEVDGIVATVNNEAVLESDLRAFKAKLDSAGMIDELILGSKTPADLKKDPALQLDYLISEKLLDSEIKRLSLSVTVEKVEQEIREVAKRNHMSRAELAQALTAQGIRMSEYQDFMKTRIERQSLLEQEITSKIRVSDEDVLAEYLRRNPKAEAGAEFTIAHIFFNPKKGGPAAAEARALDVVKKLKAGQSFESLAEQHSEDSDFAQGGLLGTFKTGEINPEFERAVANLSSGETSQVVVSKSGLHILKLLNKKVIPDPRFEQEKEKIRAALTERSFQKQFQNWLQMKREEAFVRNTPKKA